MDEFVARESIREFCVQLETEVDPHVRSLLQRLLIFEGEKLGHNSDTLRKIEAEIAKAKVRVDKQQALLAAMEGNGRNTAGAVALLNSLSDGVLIFEEFRQTILAALNQSSL